MTRTESADLQRVVRMKCRIARSDIDVRAATVLAEFEAQLAHEFDPQDAMVADLREEATATVERLNDELQQRCAHAGVPRDWAPSLNMFYFRRGENSSASKRAELRKVANSRMEQVKRAAKLAVDRAESDMATALIANRLDSSESKDWLAALPTPESLIPALDIAEFLEVTDDARATVRALMQ